MESRIQKCPKHGEYISYHCIGNGMDFWSTCDKCVDEFDSEIVGYTDSQKTKDYNFMHCGAGEVDLRNAGFDKYVSRSLEQDKNMLRVKEQLNQMINGKGNTLCFYGENGTGKTYMGLSCLKLWCETRTEPVKSFIEVGKNKKPFDLPVVNYNWGKYITSDDLCDFVVTDRKIYNSTKRMTVSFYTDVVPLLMIDEVGRTVCSNRIEHDVIFRVVSERVSKGLPTILTTNYTLEQFSTMLGNALMSRIDANGAFIEYSKNIPDMRKK